VGRASREVDRARCAALIAAFAAVTPAFAQEEGGGAAATAPAFRLYRWQDDYSYLANCERKAHRRVFA
jgi:hypothetical protein